jgi:Tol biopolymer transport system component
VQKGAKFGRYELIAALGKGGMGEVYLARDSTVGRDVAIKVLPRELVADENRLSRLRREARLLASLNHPNIAMLYGFEEDHGVPFLVIEFVAGETLADRLRRGPMSLRAAMDMALQIAAALTAAHERRVVHRDLKPSNVMLTSEDRVKLLDFGVARREPAADTGADTSTDTSAERFHTGEGQLVGTLAYMSPEQLRGLPVDQRCDIWAFGCLLYEAITARHPFMGSTSTDVVAAILEREPDWRLLEHCPVRFVDIVKRCLRKDRDQRVHHIADPRIEIEEILAGDSEPVWNGRRSRWKPLIAVLGGLLLVAMGVIMRGHFGSSETVEPVRRLAVELDGTLAFGIDYPASVAISADGSRIAFVAESAGERLIHVRALDGSMPHPLPGTRGAQKPFFSPDGRSLGFFADGKLKRISVRGGAPLPLCDAPRGMGGVWSPEGWIVFAPSNSSGLKRVSENGGDAEPFTAVRLDAGEQAHYSPVLLPDQNSVLFTVWTGGRNMDSRIAIQASDQTNHRIVLDGGSHGYFLSPHWLIYGRGSELLAAEFDAVTGTTRGTPFTVQDGVQDTPAVGESVFALSDEGTLVYAPAGTSRYGGRIVWLDRTGHSLGNVEAGGAYYRPRLSPDGAHMLFHFADADFNIWIKDLARGSLSKLTKTPGWDGFGVWSPDGQRIAFSSARDGSRTLFIQAADGNGTARRLLPSGNPRWPTSWTAHADRLVFHEEDPQTGLDVWLLDLRDGSARPFLRTAANESWARFSPDGQWIAYDSDESGSFEVYVRSVEKTDQVLQVSAGGGLGAIWSPMGNEIYYNRATQLMVVPIRAGRSLDAGRPEVLFTAGTQEVNDVSADGGRFLAADAPTDIAIGRLHLVLGWRQHVARLSEMR